MNDLIDLTDGYGIAILNGTQKESSQDNKNLSKLIQINQCIYSRCLKITEKVSFNIASEASYIHF